MNRAFPARKKIISAVFLITMLLIGIGHLLVYAAFTAVTKDNAVSVSESSRSDIL